MKSFSYAVVVLMLSLFTGCSEEQPTTTAEKLEKKAAQEKPSIEKPNKKGEPTIEIFYVEFLATQALYEASMQSFLQFLSALKQKDWEDEIIMSLFNGLQSKENQDVLKEVLKPMKKGLTIVNESLKEAKSDLHFLYVNEKKFPVQIKTEFEKVEDILSHYSSFLGQIQEECVPIRKEQYLSLRDLSLVLEEYKTSKRICENIRLDLDRYRKK